MKHTKTAILFSLGFLTMMAGDGNAVPPPWFQDALKTCKEKIPGDLEYWGGDWVCHMESPSRKRLGKDNTCTLENIRPITVTDNMGIGDGYFRGVLRNPGLGKCCVFDDKGTILEAKVITTGQDGCTEMMNNNPKAKHSGIWWYVSKVFYLSLDWWYKGK